jgi:hypothetical protein
MENDLYTALLERLRALAPGLFAVPVASLEPTDTPVGKLLAWPVSGEPGVAEWFTLTLIFDGESVSVEHCFCSENQAIRADDVREYGPFDLTAPGALGNVEACLQRIARHPTF